MVGFLIIPERIHQQTLQGTNAADVKNIAGFANCIVSFPSTNTSNEDNVDHVVNIEV